MRNLLKKLAGTTRLELATSAVTDGLSVGGFSGIKDLHRHAAALSGVEWAREGRFCATVCATLLVTLLLAPLANTQPCATQDAFRIPFTDEHGVILVTLPVDEKPISLLLDTGATRSSFPKEGLIEIRMAEHSVYAVHASEWGLFNNSNRKTFALLGIGGILGQDFLHKFKSVRIDYANHMLDLEAR